MEQSLPFDVDALLVFGKVVECHSLSKAATLLGMPKSTVSRKLSKLESDLGIKLLRMNTHQLTVTDLGEKIYEHGVRILTEANGVRAWSKAASKSRRVSFGLPCRSSSASTTHRESGQRSSSAIPTHG